jgi:hypothetical protein
MHFVAYAVLSYVLPVVIGLVAAALWWRQLANPWLFGLVAVLTTVGLQQVLSAAWSALRLGLRSGGFYLEANTEAAIQAMAFEAAGVAMLLLVLGWPLLLQVRNALPKL